MTAQFASHGRGGAGNMADAAKSAKINAADLETPVLKTPVVTTGRGGTGNMTRNDDPKETRLRQDVAAVPRRLSAGAQLGGRGGAGNVFKGDDEGLEDLARNRSIEQAIDEAPERTSDRASDKSVDKTDKAEGKTDKAEGKTDKSEGTTAKRRWLFGKK